MQHFTALYKGLSGFLKR